MPESPVDITGGVPPPRWGLRPTEPNRPDDAVPQGTAFIAGVRRYRWIALATVCLIPFATWIGLLFIKPMYVATGSLVYQATAYQPRELQSVVRVDPITEQTMTTQAEILQSLRIAEQVAQRGNLFANPAFNPILNPPSTRQATLGAICALLGMDTEALPPEPVYGPVPQPGYEATLRATQAALHASPARVSHVIEVSFTANDPIVAAAGANNAMDAYIKGLYAEKHQKIDQAKAQLEQQARDLRRSVSALEKQISDYREAHAIQQGIHASVDTEQITRLSEDLTHARADLDTATARLDAAQAGRGAADHAAVATSVVQFRARRDQLLEKLQAQLTRLGPQHPDTQAIRSQLNQAETALDAEVARIIAAGKADQHAAMMRLHAAEEALDAARQAAGQADHAMLPLNAMNRDLEAIRGQLATVLEAIQRTSLQANIEFPEAHEISLALPPDRPISPRVIQTLAAAGVAGVFLALLLVHALQRLDDTVQSGADIRALTGLPCVALIPELGRRALRSVRVHEYSVQRPLSTFAEQVRALRAAIGLDADRPRVIAITAARPAEGKSVIALSLARSAQIGGERVLAIECDVRQASFQQRLGDGSTPQPGLLDILRGEVPWHDALRKDRMTGIAAITAGRAARMGGQERADVLGLFMSDTMRRLLAEVRANYDLIVLDVPPIEAVTEARIVASLADATLVCVRWRHTQGKTLQHALNLLRECRAKVLGTILTRVDTHAHLRSGNADAGVYHRRYHAYFRE